MPRVEALSSRQRKAAKSSRIEDILYPHIVSKGSVRVTIYRVTNAARGEVYEVTWFQGGTRKRKSFRDPVEALKQAEDTAKALDTGKGDSLALSGAELESFRLAKSTLAQLEEPPPLHSAIQEFVAARKLLDGRPLIGSIEKFMADATADLLKPIAVPVLVEEFIASKQADGVSERYIQDCRSRLGRFGRDFKTQVAHVKTGDIDTWLRALRHSPRSRNNYRVLLVTMFRFARACGYLPRDRSTEADHIARAKDNGNPIEIYSSEEMQDLLNHSDDHTLPFVALAGFAGLRSAEILRLTWESIKWDQNLIEVKAQMAKTAQRRLVPLSVNLAKCLKKWRKAKGPVIGPVKLFMRLEWLAEASGVKWKRNALRHSYASYRLAIIHDAGRLALEMGNSPSMVFRHYRELVTAPDAEKWFALAPKPNPAKGAADLKKIKRTGHRGEPDDQPLQT
jgi:integrase